MNIDLWNRRSFLSTVGTLTLSGVVSVAHAAEPPPETTRIRLLRFPFDVACLAPLWIAEELLRSEGFVDVQYVTTADQQQALGAGELDIGMNDVFSVLLNLDTGKPLVVLGGIHAGCFELFGTSAVRAIRDLKGKTVAVTPDGGGRRAFVSAMAAHVGLDPRKDMTFLEHSGREGMRLLEESRVDAFLGFPPEPQEMRARKIGFSVVNTATDRPWSQYFCCVAIGNREFVRKYPVATKRALRALLKAADICAAEPERTARTIVERGFLKNDAYVAQTLREIPYKRWRDSDSADSLRFYALRLHEAGVIKSSPQKLLAQGTDWRFVDQLRKELKA